jgi:membrane protein implicated in regulation of membrane protease activity
MAGEIVFAVFVVAMLVLAVLVTRFAMRLGRKERAAARGQRDGGSPPR